MATTATPRKLSPRSKVRLSRKGTVGLFTGSTRQTIEKIKVGFDYSKVTYFQSRTRFTLQEIADVTRVPGRTLSRRKQEKRLKPDESERLLRFSRVFDLATDLFEGDPEATRRWFLSPVRALGDLPPFEMVKTEIGAREVEDLIGRLEHGVFA